MFKVLFFQLPYQYGVQIFQLNDYNYNSTRMSQATCGKLFEESYLKEQNIKKNVSDLKNSTIDEMIRLINVAQKEILHNH